MRVVLVAVVCFALAMAACVTYSVRDKSGRMIADYGAAIKKEPRNHELYYNRALLYVEQYYYDSGELKRCAEDMDKAIGLRGSGGSHASGVAGRSGAVDRRDGVTAPDPA
jgi:hypothetical protein